MTYRQTLLSISLVALMLPGLALAQAASVIFERTDIRIESPPPTTKNPNPGHPSLKYSIEVRPEDALRLEYIHTLNTMTDSNGVMIAFNAPSMVALPQMKVYTPIDALFVTETGTVAQILPNVTLGDLNQEVMAHEPVKAFLFLKAGQVAARNIRPKDTVTGPMFTPAPPVME